MDPFYYEIVAAPDGAALVSELQALIDGEPTLAAAANPWRKKTRPVQSDLYALLVVVTHGLATDANSREKVEYASSAGFPVIPVVADGATHDFANAIDEVRERNAESLASPERLLRTVLHHGGLRLFAGGGHVFISYARRDGTELANRIRAALMAANIGSTVDVHEIVGGAPIQREIEDRIRASDVVVLIDSLGAAKSPWVAEEIDIALAAHVDVVAVTPSAGGFHHALQPHHVVWPPGGDPEVAVLEMVRRLMARKLGFRARVLRILVRLAKLREWQVSPADPHWSLDMRSRGRLLVACTPDPPLLEDIVRVMQAAGEGRGMLVAGVRPFQPDTRQGLAAVGAGAVCATPLPWMASKIPVRVARPTTGRVFLSAAMPSDPDDVERARNALAHFVVTLTQALVELGVTLVFGGHPSVTPLVHRAIRELGQYVAGKVELHQARTWENDSLSLSDEVRAGPLFRKLHYHGDRTSSAGDVAALRDAMIRPGLTAGIFVGGKTSGFLGSKPGIIDEHERFRAACPDAPAFVPGFAGGAAATIPPTTPMNRLLRTTSDPDLAVALIVAELLGT